MILYSLYYESMKKGMLKFWKNYKTRRNYPKKTGNLLEKFAKTIYNKADKKQKK